MNRLSKSKSDDKVSMFVGMDLHKNYLQIAVMNKEGRILRNSKIDNEEVSLAWIAIRPISLHKMKDGGR